MLGEDLGPLSIKELQQLEKQLEYALSQARQRKVHIMYINTLTCHDNTISLCLINSMYNIIVYELTTKEGLVS